MIHVVSKYNWYVCIRNDSKLSRVTDIDWVMRRIKTCVKDQENLLQSTANTKQHQVTKYSSFINTRCKHFLPASLPFFVRVNFPCFISQCSVLHISHPYMPVIVDCKTILFLKTFSVIHIENCRFKGTISLGLVESSRGEINPMLLST